MSETPEQQPPTASDAAPVPPPPPAGSTPPASGWPAPPPGYGPPPLSPQDERTWSMLSHLLAIVGGFIAPLVIMLTKGKESPYVRHHAVESLNFQLTKLIAIFISSFLMLILVGFFLILAVAIAALVFEILAGLTANRGELYRYPINIRMVT